MAVTFSPRTATNVNQLQAEVDAVLDAAHAAYLRGDLEAVSKTIDFPVLMVTDNSKADGMATTWDREQFLHHHAAVAREFSPDAMEGIKSAKRSRNYTFISDTIVAVNQEDEASLEGKAVKWKSFALLAKSNGTWRVKAQAEGGWGDTIMARG